MLKLGVYWYLFVQRLKNIAKEYTIKTNIKIITKFYAKTLNRFYPLRQIILSRKRLSL